jgi:hypothetical protein
MNYDVGLLYIESLAQRGEPEKALKLSSVFLNSRADYVDMWIQQARVHEQFGLKKDDAINSYQKALSKSTLSEQKDWLKKKIEFLKSSKSNQVTLNVDGN